MRWLIFFIFVAHAAISFSQESDQQLATYYYNAGDFEKASMYYGKLFEKDPSKINFNRYFECLTQTNQLKEAERVLKKQLNANKFDLEYTVLYAQFLEENKEPEKAQKLYKEMIDDIRPDANSVISVFNAFRSKGKNDLALQAIEKGRKLLKGSYPLHFQFAELYGALGETDKMIAEYLDVLDYSMGYLQTVQTILSRQIDFAEADEKTYEIVRTSLLERIQKRPDSFVYNEMLIWLFIQKRNFSAALSQAQALDKRTEQTGSRVMELGKICVENRMYDVARKAYQYVKGLGESLPNYYAAENALLNVRFLEVTTNRNYSTVELNATLAEYNQVIKRIGKKRQAIELLIEMGHIMAFYGDKADSAILLLNDALNIAGLTDIQKAEVKMQLADIHVLHGDIWEASLLYLQIESDFKFEPIGFEAKFKNARIYYYDGEFDFAQSQLSVLKESTSKLISNDAINLSLLITDNFGLDSNYQAMNWFAKADLLIEQHQYTEAFSLFDSIITTYPYHSLGDEILLRKSKAMQLQGEWTKAIAYLEELLKYHGTDILADDALFQLGDIYQFQLNDPEKAAEFYKKILFEYKGSLYGIEARKRYRELRGDKLTEDEEI
jgi:tetratricopeptide (TPR) repeat protein